MFNPADQTYFSLTIDGLDNDFQVLEFTGHEGISRLYRFDLELVSENPEVDLASVLHKEAFLALDPSGRQPSCAQFVEPCRPRYLCDRYRELEQCAGQSPAV
jgi:uncharacterized protein involved in type VI secretion and phage assembly